MDKDLLNHLVAAATTIAPMIVPGAGSIIAVGKGIADALEAGRDMLDPDEAKAIDEAVLDDLRARVNEHFDDTIAGLRGDKD